MAEGYTVVHNLEWWADGQTDERTDRQTHDDNTTWPRVNKTLQANVTDRK